MQKAKVLSWHSTATLMNGGASPNASAFKSTTTTCRASRHDGDGDGDGDGGRVLIMKNAKS